MQNEYDIIIVGGGHAGCEAAAAAARMGCRVALVSFSRDTIGAMSCNPAIGGLGKGHLVKEIDALDGIMGRAADAAAIHYRMLNQSKGAAVRGPRIQADRNLFKASVQRQLSEYPTLSIVEGEAAYIHLSKEDKHGNAGDNADKGNKRIKGLYLADGRELIAPNIILATGTFLGGKMFCGENVTEGGRVEEKASNTLALQLEEMAIPISRMKTGTPPRLNGHSIDWAALEEQPSDPPGWHMSEMTRKRANPQIFCAITRTNEDTHNIIRGNLHRSPIYSGAIEAMGPRYCPSIEDKVERFADRNSHQIFLEPEGLDTHFVYPNGISTSLPEDVQLSFLRTMKGLENVEIEKAGYAVEYFHVDPRILTRGLEISTVPGLFCAGQINGTTGYEEAAAQGLIAGLAAAAKSKNIEEIKLDRARAYISVMIDDLIIHGVTEPYRMLTARAEYRLRLRADNAARRLTPIGIDFGCIRDDRRRYFTADDARYRALREALDVKLSGDELRKKGFDVKKSTYKQSLYEWLRYPEIEIDALGFWIERLDDYAPSLRAEMKEDALYFPYIERQNSEVKELRANAKIRIAPDFDYYTIAGLSNEMVERLSRARPENMAQAGQVRGVTPAALAAILVSIRRAGRDKRAANG